MAGSQTIAEVCFHMIADDRRPHCDLRSTIIWKPALNLLQDRGSPQYKIHNFFFLNNVAAMKLQKVPADNKHEVGFSLYETDYSDKDDWARISIPSRVFNGKGRGWNYCSDAVCND